VAVKPRYQNRSKDKPGMTPPVISTFTSSVITRIDEKAGIWQKDFSRL
jgi:hypothetical protein